MGIPHLRPRAVWITAPLLAAQLVGVFVLPAIVAFVAAFFLEVSEVAATAGPMLAITLALLLPVALLQIAGLLWKSTKEIRFWRERAMLSVPRVLDVLATHAGVVTVRGWTLLLLGCLLTIVALWLQWASFGLLAMIGLLLFYLVTAWTLFASTFLVRTFERTLGRSDASIERRMEPSVVQCGDSVDEVFRVRRVPVPAGYVLLIEDPLHPLLATESRYAVGARVRAEEVTVSGGLRATPRGYYELGPARLSYQDLLGLTRVSVASVATAALKVLPRIRSVTILEPPRSPSDQPDVLTRPHRFPTEDHFRFREYAAGDDTRRIHWRLSMKHGHLQVRVPETRETTTKSVVLVLDSYMPRPLMRAAEGGAHRVLDELVDAWIGLAAELVQRGDQVTLVASVRQHDTPDIVVERIAARKGEVARWQDLGARVAWQDVHDVDALLSGVGATVHGIVATGRVLGPPPTRLDGADTTWIVVEPGRLLRAGEPHWLVQLAGSNLLARVGWALRLPHPAGSEDNNLWRRVVATLRIARAWSARRTLRAAVARGGDRLIAALVARGDAVYAAENTGQSITFRGIAAQRGGTASR